MTRPEPPPELVACARLHAEQAGILAREAIAALAEGRQVTLPHRDSSWRPAHVEVSELHSRYGARRIPGASTLTADQVLRRSLHVCYLCGGPVLRRHMQIEHIIPIALGGEHVDENLAAAHGPCNARKRDRIVACSIETRAVVFCT